jgi:hypothetical protein
MLPLIVSASAISAGEVKTTLKGSRASMERQNQIAHELDYSFLRTDRQVAKLADAGRLVAVTGGADYRVLASWPYARPVVKQFVERLASDYRAGCGEPLVVTSLTRPSQKQPGNASPLSVHPAGMAVDLRVSRDAGCVTWLQKELLGLEERGVIDATREYNPPHFHIAVFPEPYQGYVAQLVADSAAAAELARVEQERRAAEAASAAAFAQVVPEAAPGRPPRLLVALVSLLRFMLPV